jgi:hypothetical protein
MKERRNEEMGRRNGNKTAGRVRLTLYVAVLALVWTGCPDPTTELRYVDREVPTPFGIRIETAAQLGKIGLDPEFPSNGEYYLGNDIDLADWGKPETPAEPGETPTEPTTYLWKPIGSTCPECGGPLIPVSGAALTCQNEDCALFGVSQEPFSGILHGNGKKISGLVLSPQGEDTYKDPVYVGLFGYIQNAQIHDLTLELVTTSTPADSDTENELITALYLGALSGFARGSRIENITVQPNPGPGLSLELSRANNYVGGVVGKAEGTSFITIASTVGLKTQETTGVGAHAVGGIAGELASGAISKANMRGDIELGIAGPGSKYAGGIVGNASGQGGTLTKNEVVLGALKIQTNVPDSSQTAPSIYAGGIAGSTASVLACSAQLGTLELTADEGLTPLRSSVGGLCGGGAIENSSARFESITVTGTDTMSTSGGYPNVYVGGLTGSGAVTRSHLEGTGSIVVTGGAYNANFRVGGLAGSGAISRSWIGYGIPISLAIGSVSTHVYAGGLTGDGRAEYSFIGSKADPAAVTVTKTENMEDTRSLTANTYVGGISGQATTASQYNYAFCAVSLEMTGSGSTGSSPTGSVGGLLGYLTNAYTQSYAAGSVQVTDNTSSGGFHAGGIAGSIGPGAAVNITGCAALNPELSIGGTNTTGVKNWRRIAYKTLNTSSNSLASLENNITTVTGTPPTGYTLDDGASTEDGMFKDSALTQQDFSDWDFENIWEWDSTIGLPVLKEQVFKDEA